MTDPFSSEYKHTCRSSMCLLAAAVVVQYLTMDMYNRIKPKIYRDSCTRQPFCLDYFTLLFESSKILREFSDSVKKGVQYILYIYRNAPRPPGLCTPQQTLPQLSARRQSERRKTS